MTTLGSRHAAVLRSLLEQQKQELFADLEVQLEDKTVRVSRNLFAALSDVFKQMLVTNMTEGRNRTVKLENVTSDVWHCAYQFYFTTEDSLTEETVGDVVQFAHMYQLDDLKDRCSTFLLCCCSVKNCLAVWRLSRLFDLVVPDGRAMDTIARNFISITKQEDFLALSKDDILNLLDNDDLVTTEDELCTALLSWTENNRLDEDVARSIFSHVRFSRLSDGVIERLLENELLGRNTTIYCKVLTEHMRIFESSNSPERQSEPRRRGPPAGKEATIVLGHARGRLYIYCWSPETKTWSTLSRKSFPPYFSSTKLNNTIVVTGGGRGIAKTEMFDLRTMSWSSGPDLNQGRHCHGMAVVYNTAFVVGGRCQGKALASIEKYDRVSSRWETAGHLTYKKTKCSVAALGSVLIVGACGSYYGIMFQAFDVITRTTSVISSPRMFSGLSYLCSASFEDTVYFLDDRMQLYELRKRTIDGSITCDENVRFDGFYGFHDENCGLSVDANSLTLYGGSWDDTSVERFDFHGNRIGNGDMGTLPTGLRVNGVFKIKIRPT